MTANVRRIMRQKSGKLSIRENDVDLSRVGILGTLVMHSVSM